MSMRRAVPSAPTWKKWVIEQTAAGKARGDQSSVWSTTVWCRTSTQPTILPMYLVSDCERIAQEYADAGMSVVFTGHMHAVDIAAMTTKAGNTFYDIETGSALTYPCPVRFVDLRRSTVGGETNTHEREHQDACRPHKLHRSCHGRCACDR